MSWFKSLRATRNERKPPIMHRSNTDIGKLKQFLTTYSYSFIILPLYLVQCIGVFVLSGYYIYTTVIELNYVSPLAMVLSQNTFYCLLLCLSILALGLVFFFGIFTNNHMMVLVGAPVSYVFVLVRSIIFYCHSPYLIPLILLCINSMFVLPYGIMVIQRARGVGKQLYQLVGGNKSLLALYLNYEFVGTLMILSFCSQFIIFIMGISILDYGPWYFLGGAIYLYVSMVLIPIVFVIGVRAELACVVIPYILFSLLAPIYVLYKVIMLLARLHWIEFYATYDDNDNVFVQFILINMAVQGFTFCILEIFKCLWLGLTIIYGFHGRLITHVFRKEDVIVQTVVDQEMDDES